MYGEDHMWTYQGYRIALLYGSLDFFLKYIDTASLSSAAAKKIYMIKSYKKRGYYYANKKEKGI